jgi:hypothetical protein
MPSPRTMPTPPALKYAAWALEITLITPAMPIVSSDLLHSLPNSATPRSMSVKSQVRRAVGPPSAGEQPHSFRDLLLEVDAQARSAGVLAHRRERVASVKARGLGEVDGGRPPQVASSSRRFLWSWYEFHLALRRSTRS